MTAWNTSLIAVQLRQRVGYECGAGDRDRDDSQRFLE